MLLRIVAALAATLLLVGCVTTPGCRWRLIVEPRITAAYQAGQVRPVPSLLARPVCLPKRHVIETVVLP